MSELLPCPFCGGEAFVNDDPTGNGGKPHMSGNVGLGRLWSVECDECGADAGFWQDRDVAIAAWNSRVERTCEFTPDGMMDDRLWYSCSNCGGYITTDYGMPSYCPHCGARTVGE